MEPKPISSSSNMFSRAAGAQVLTLLLVVLLLTSSSMLRAEAYRGNSSWYPGFDPEATNWELFGETECGNFDAANYPSLEYRSRHQWVDFCGDLGPYTGDHGCLRCLQVTNPATGASGTVRIVEICDIFYDEDLVLILDEVAFGQIDTTPSSTFRNRQGIRMLEVDYDLTDCGDD